MPLTAPLPRTRVPSSPTPGARAPDTAPVLELLIASRPEREGNAIALAVGGALGLHLLLFLLLLLLGPFGGQWFPNLPVATSPDQPTITLMLPGTDLGGARRAAPAPAPAAGEPRLVAPTRIPTTIPSPPRAGPGAPAQGASPGAGRAAAGQAGAEAGPGGVGANMTAADRLRPHGWDRRLWEPPDQLAPTETENARVAGRIQNRIDAINDSANAIADAARRSTDWTVKDKNGKSWGVSPGKLHLGDVTLPLPFGFTVPPGRRDDFAREGANWNAIQRSATNAEIRHTFDDRVKAIRERKERERQQQKKDEKE